MIRQKIKETFSFHALNWILLILCTIIWGFSYFFIKHSLTGFQPIEVLSLRALAAGITLLPFVYTAFKKIPKEKYGYVFLCTLLGNGIPMYLYPLAQTHISSSVAGIVNSLTPLCVYIIGIFFFHLHNTRLKLIGVVVGLLGAVCLIVFKPSAELKADFFFLCVALTAPIMYGISSNFLKKHLSGLPGIPLTAMMYLMLLPGAIALFFNCDIPHKIATNEAAQQALPYTLMLGVLGTALAMSLFNVLIKRAHIMFASSVSYLMPLVAVMLGVIDNERLASFEIFGLVLILVGVILINWVRIEKP
jgi:drug/metabolite transporter (DMT)-like permease